MVCFLFGMAQYVITWTGIMVASARMAVQCAVSHAIIGDPDSLYQS